MVIISFSYYHVAYYVFECLEKNYVLGHCSMAVREVRYDVIKRRQLATLDQKDILCINL
jgi:hypothetical protein